LIAANLPEGGVKIERHVEAPKAEVTVLESRLAERRSNPPQRPHAEINFRRCLGKLVRKMHVKLIPPNATPQLDCSSFKSQVGDIQDGHQLHVLSCKQGSNVKLEGRI
jgi:hypothetical protein